MIIVSQNKDRIVNFDNVNFIGVNTENGEFVIEINYADSNWDTIGWYKTEERAREILKEMAKKYENSMWKLGRNTLSFQDEFIYEMPEN